MYLEYMHLYTKKYLALRTHLDTDLNVIRLEKEATCLFEQ